MRTPQSVRAEARSSARRAASTAMKLIAAAVLMTALPIGAQTDAAKASSSGSSGNHGEDVYLNFPNADLETVVRAVGQLTGRTFVIDPRVKGTLNLVTERPVNKQQAYEQLLAALRLSGFTLVDSGQPNGIVRILPEADAKLQGSRVIAPNVKAPAGDQIITQVFRLQSESATAMVPVLRPLIAPNNTISAVPGSNSLIITDYADNLRRIGKIIETLDPASSADSEFITLKHGLALEIAATVSRALDAGQTADASQRVSILAEPRTNMLIVRSANPARVKAARQLIERLDQPSVTPGNINVIYLRNAEAVKLAPLLRAVLAADPSFVQASGGGGLSATSSTSSMSGLSSTGATTQAPGLAAQQQTQAPASTTTGGSSGGGNSALSGMIQPDAATNSLIITAPEPLYRNIRTIVEKLDSRRAQVVIETLMVEVNADKAAEFGIQFQALSGLNSSDASVIGGTNFNSTTGGSNIIGAATNLSSVGPGLSIGVVKGSITLPGLGTITNLGFLARALETNAGANILSRPNIQTLDNEEAKFLVGQNLPFVTGSFTQTSTGATNPFQTYERKDVGLQLRVKPQISEGGTVKMAIYLEVSSVVPGTASSGFITNKRSFESNLLVEDGDFVVLSGLIEDRSNTSVSKVPILGDLPFIGALFRYENRDRSRTNTMVFLRPTIVRNATTSTALAADRYDYMRSQINRARQPETPIFNDYNVDPATVDRNAPPSKPGDAPTVAPVRPSDRVQILELRGIGDLNRGRQVVHDLREAGYDAYWETLNSERGDSIRVRIAVDQGRQEIGAVTAALMLRGLEPTLVKQER